MTRFPKYPPILAAAIDAGCSNPPGRSRVHGSHHWKCVAEVALWLADAISERDKQAAEMIDRDLIATFAILHDVERRHDGGDYGHGLRAELLFRRLLDRGQLRPAWESLPSLRDNDRIYTLAYALRNHCMEDYPYNLLPSPRSFTNVAICWDADRLCRYRLHETPDNSYLITREAKSRAGHQMAAAACAEPHKRIWHEILDYPGSLTRAQVDSRV